MTNNHNEQKKKTYDFIASAIISTIVTWLIGYFIAVPRIMDRALQDIDMIKADISEIKKDNKAFAHNMENIALKQAAAIANGDAIHQSLQQQINGKK